MTLWMLALACAGDSLAPSYQLITQRNGPNAPTATLQLTPVMAAVDVGGTVQLKAAAYQGDTVLTSAAFSWNSQHPSIVTVDGNGLVQGLSAGDTYIEASALGQTISSLVRVSRFPVGSSARTSLGWLIRARAMHTRCCSPPESWEGIW